MSKLIVSKVKVSKQIFESKELSALLDKIKKYDETKDLLPEPFETLSFELDKTYTGFANGIRRVLVEELPVYCLDTDHKNVETDDEFILNDMLIKNINLIPIIQEIKEPHKVHASIDVYNNTNDVMDVHSREIKIEGAKLINNNIIFARLRPGKHLVIKNLKVIRGFSKYNAAKFSLLNNIKYYPLDHEPFDIHTNKGTRSIMANPQKFYIEFTTCGNIELKTVITLLHEQLTSKLESLLNSIKKYNNDESKKYYYTTELEVKVDNDLYVYNVPGEYLTLAQIVTQKCYTLDTNVLHASYAIERYDNEVAIIKLKHSEPNKLLMNAIQSCIEDLDMLKKEVLKHL